MRAGATVSISALLASSCGAAPAGSSGAAAPADGSCGVTLSPRSAPRVKAVAGASREVAPSHVIAEFEAPLARLSSELERRIGTRLAEERGVGLGPAGSLNYTVDRGPFSVSVAGGKLVVETEVQARAEACSRGSCYASCEPRATVRAEISLALRPDYRFEKARVTATFTRACKIRVLGGFLTVDITPTLESQLKPQLANAGRSIDQQIPDIRAETERAWQELSMPRELPLGGCAVLQPVGFVQGPVEDSRNVLRARAALLLRPELRGDCDETSQRAQATPLPPLGFDAAMPREGVATLGMVMPISSVARAFEIGSGGAARKASYRVTRADVSSSGRSVDAELSLQGGACGDIALRAAPEFAGDGRFVTLKVGSFDAGERARVAAAGLDPKAFAEALVSLPEVAVPLSPASIGAILPALAAGLSNQALSVKVDVTASRPAGAMARGEELVAFVEVRGGLRLGIAP
jgi:hypothetical protein